MYLWYMKKEFENEANEILSNTDDLKTTVSSFDQMCIDGKGYPVNLNTHNISLLMRTIQDYDENPYYVRFEVAINS